jgi:hypothetical protein
LPRIRLRGNRELGNVPSHQRASTNTYNRASCADDRAADARATCADDRTAYADARAAFSDDSPSYSEPSSSNRVPC